MSIEQSNMPRVLVVDDDLLISELLERTLGAAGYDVIVAHSAEDGLNAAKYRSPHLVLLDVVLPEMSGFQACERLNELHKDTYVPVILVTAMDDVDAKIRGLESGAYDYVTKPFDQQELLARVRSAFRTKTLYDELRDTREKLTEAEKLAALGEMAITLHHQINNPLQAIVLSAENLLSDLPGGTLPKEDIEIILASCSRIHEVLRRITHLKRVRSATYIGKTDMLDLDRSI